MRLDIFLVFTECPPWNYGGTASRAATIPRALLRLAVACAALLLSATVLARAEQASQTGFDPRQTEKHFDDLRSEQSRPARSALRMPALARPAPQADNKPLFVLRGVSLAGASAIPQDQIAKAYQPYLGKRVSQADLAAIATAISETYRSAGFQLSRAIVPPQDIQNGSVRIQIIEGSITEVTLEGEGAEKFGIRSFLDPCLLYTSPSPRDS